MANYVASGVQWHQSYGSMHYRGNVSKNKGPQRRKNPTTPQSVSESEASESEKDKSNAYLHYEPSDRTLRTHFPNAKVQGRRGDTVQEQFSAKKMKLGGDIKGETFFMDDFKQETPSAGKKGDEFTRPSSFEINELCSDSGEDEVQEIHADPNKKISASKNKETSESSQKFHGSTPQRLMSPMKSSEKMYNQELSEKQTPRQPIGGSENQPAWLGPLLNSYTENMKVFVKDEIEKARLKQQENKKDEAEKKDKENSEGVEEDKKQGS
jgi:hypothetical protein